MITAVMSLATEDDSRGATDKLRATHAAKDFEALLIGNLLRSMQQSFSTLTAEGDKAAGFDDYHYIATQAIAGALSSAGGLGLSKMILKQLVRS